MEQKSKALSNHIFPVAATMVGVCITVISLIRIAPDRVFAVWIDNVVAVGSMFFLVSMFLSYWSIRHRDYLLKIERYADRLFLIGMAILGAVSVMVAFEIFID
jgi:fumarate reductase subunit D